MGENTIQKRITKASESAVFRLNLLIATGGSIVEDVWEEGDYTSAALESGGKSPFRWWQIS